VRDSCGRATPCEGPDNEQKENDGDDEDPPRKAPAAGGRGGTAGASGSTRTAGVAIVLIGGVAGVGSWVSVWGGIATGIAVLIGRTGSGLLKHAAVISVQ